MLDRIIIVGLTAACITLGAILYRHHASAPSEDEPTVVRPVPIVGPAPIGDNSHLDAKIPLVRFQEVPVGRALLMLADMAHANLAVRWSRLSVAGVSEAQPITLRMENASFRQTLAAIIMDLKYHETEHPSFAVINGVVIVSTYGDFEPDTVVCIPYNIQDLIERHIKIGDQHDDAARRIERILMNEISPDSWMDAGGTLGNAQEFGGVLLITHRPAEQAEVEALLQKLRGPEGERLLFPKSETSPATN